jgi:threonine/homoserine/homoserine lactone efflux protein
VSPEFLLTTLVLVITPGTGVLFTIAAGLARGARAGVLAAFACTLGTLPHIAAAITGLAALLHTSAVAFQVVKYLGVAYLLYMAWATFRDRGALTVDEEEAAPRSARQVIVSGVLVNILNPKLSIFFVAFLPQFVTSGSPALPQMLVLSAVFMAVTFLVFAGYGLFAAAVRRHVLCRPQVLTWMRRTFGGAFLALGGKLALTER